MNDNKCCCYFVMAPVIISRPILLIQSDWDEVLGTVTSNAWVSCKSYGGQSEQGNIKRVLQKETNMPQLLADGKFKVITSSKNSVTISHEDPNCKCIFYAPERTFTAIHQKSIASIDVTSKGLGVSVCSENRLVVWATDNGSILRTLLGHKWDVYKCRFFPSGLVILSAGADMLLKIWSAETGKCPVTLTGHTAAITDTAIVDRGRNIVSVAKDGSAKLWDCGGESTCLGVLFQTDGNINCCSVADVSMDVGEPDISPSEREIATDGKLLLAGCENGKLYGIGLKCRKQMFEMEHASAVNCCCFISEFKAVCGTQDGKLYLINLNNTSEFDTIWEESASAVLCLLPSKDGFFAGRADGTVMYVALDDDAAVQLTGSEFDPVYCMSADSKSVFTGCRDGVIRKYTLPNTKISFL